MRHILKDQKPVPCTDLAEWERWYRFSLREVARTRIGSVLVSTVFLGWNAQFETKVFGGEHDQKVNRYSSWDQAYRGHRQIVLTIGRKK